MASATSVKPRPKSTSNKLVSPSSSNFSKEKKNKRETDATNRPDPAMEPISLFFQSILHRCFFFSTASAVESRDEPPSSEYPFLEEDFQSARFDVDFVGFWICFLFFFLSASPRPLVRLSFRCCRLLVSVRPFLFGPKEQCGACPLVSFDQKDSLKRQPFIIFSLDCGAFF